MCLIFRQMTFLGQNLAENRNISIDEKQYPDDVMISLCVDGVSSPICYKASEGLSQNGMDCLDNGGYDDIKIIVDAVHQAKGMVDV